MLLCPYHNLLYASAAIRRHEIRLLFVYYLKGKTPGGAQT
jgi:hypothetical protein